ncbi:nuclear transport factor 2 family protein [Flagellimonas hymeniacidonis]|uniref:Nuclear transport factor 2 family protein n=1 Tax=Flagellimonas hymeniacidonis TaxID=2603628 RepID=A0A5C8VB52_9FLAO|nr:nuclear transport factor 2 family protein [Flagellimonas hymeniacidonis]TXN38330.1 nuclear transport factor 2 family protein [Flagellimonas hymeniacidonis]
MKKLVLLFFTAGVFCAINAQESDYQLVEQTLNYYMEGGSNRDFNTLKKAFHETATMKYITDEGYKEVNALEFFSGMKTGSRIDRKNRIAEITISGHAANARLELEYPDFTFVDMMNLLKIDGEWKIVNKIFYKRMD